MFKKFKTQIFSSLASFIAIVAFSGISPKSMWIFYEPDIPAVMKDK
ncbi:MAG: cyclic lactone autoinducer peptide [Tepidanaerobacteraceae bacterium]|nr:cyclic lactone autoinducer peptide [Tepidanaerobacteraceae bacterium]